MNYNEVVQHSRKINVSMLRRSSAYDWCSAVSSLKRVSSVNRFNVDCRKAVKVHSAAVTISFDHQLALRNKTHTSIS